MSAEYQHICDWLNGHEHGKMTDFEAAMQIIESYMPEQASRMRTLRSDDRIWKLFEDRLVQLDREKEPETIPEIMPEIIPDITLSTVPVASPSQPVLSVANKSQLIKELEKENNLILKNQGYLHAQMRVIGRDKMGKPINISTTNKAKRSALRDQLVEAEAKLRENWLAIQHVQIHGCLPLVLETKEVKLPGEPVDYKAQESNRKMISYLKKQIEAKKKTLSALSGTKLVKAYKALEKMEANLAEREKQKQAWQAVN